MNKGILNWLMPVALLVLAWGFGFLFVDFESKPFEDAAMLMRYAGHLAQGEGIVWNIGESPVDGATDFLFMCAVAFLHYVGLALETAVLSLTVSAHFITVLLIYFGMRSVQGAGVWAAGLGAAYLAVGPGLVYSAAYFGTSFFAMAVAIAWLLGQRLIFRKEISLTGCLVFSFACLIAGLIRPEGVLISLFMFIAIAIGAAAPMHDLRRLAIVFTSVFAVIGGSYFIWRWNYFGHPLPNPFYKKSGFYLYSLSKSLDRSQASFMIPIFILAFSLKRSRRLAFAFFIPFIGSISMWTLLSNEMNFYNRFQYPVLVLALLSWYPLTMQIVQILKTKWSGEWKLPSLIRRKEAAITGVILVAVALLAERTYESRPENPSKYNFDGRYDVGVMLSEYQDQSYTIAVTEAVLLPLYSKWRAVDTWGLNDQWIAHHGLITEEYLHRQRPDIIMWHGYFSPGHPPRIPKKKWDIAWDSQIEVLKNYAERNDYTLAAVFGHSPKHTHYYYVHPENPHHDEIVLRIRQTDYMWGESGKISKNYAMPEVRQEK